jgi:hypothetical protein
MGIMDEFVMMRLAELIHEGLVGGAIERALASGSSGCRVLIKNAARLREALGGIRLEDPDPL